MAVSSEHEVLSRLTRALVSRYAIKQEIGRGGAAIVFLARDLKHDRNVAVKIVQPEFSALLGTERFLHEIRVAATLQHPHILPLYDSGEAEGILYYVMPYVEGESLRQRLEREHQLPVEDAISLTRKVASALDYAHRHGVIHRDIKPGNILLHEGEPIVADFGIALAITNAGGERLTESGISVGTPQYMSPEQATNDRTLGPQSDIYSLAAVAYEMLVGEPPMTGTSSQAVIARLLVDSPRRIVTVRKAVPVQVEAAILKALEKTPADRFRTAAEFGEALSRPTGSILMRRPSPRVNRMAAIIGSAIVVAVAILVVDKRRSQPATPPLSAHQVTYSGRAFSPAISPDGQFLAYAVAEGDSQRVMVQDLASGGTPKEVASLIYATTMEWSPDGTQLLFGSFDAGHSHGLVFTVPRAGGEKRIVGLASAMAENVWAYWVPDTLGINSLVSIYSGETKRVLIVDLRNDDTVAIPLRWNYDGLDAGAWSPRGNLFAVSAFSTKSFGWAIGIVRRDGHSQTAVEDSLPLGSPRWSPAGDAVYYTRDNAIWRVPLSATTGKPSGIPEKIIGGLEILVGPDAAPTFALARDGRRMAYASGRPYSNIWMIGAGRASRAIPLTTGTALRWSPVVSPDGRWIAFAQEAAGVAEIFRMPIDGGPPTRITFGARVRHPASIAWSPDGKSIAFGSVRDGRSQVWLATTESGQIKVLDKTNLSSATGHLAWAPGSRIAYLNSDHSHVQLVEAVSGDVRTIVPSTPWSILQSPQYSPDGNKIAVAWNRGAGDFGVWIFDLTGSSPEKKIADGWLWPSGWSADGRYVYASRDLSPTVYRVDTRRTTAPEPIVKLEAAWVGQSAPVREMHCTPAGRLKPSAFICTAFAFVSDIWVIDNFEPAKH